SFWQSLRYASFQTATIMSTTGYMTADFATWPIFAQTLLVALMFVGGCAGSTAGGLKISRIMLLVKNAFRTVKKELSPRSVVSVKVDKRPVEENLIKGVVNYFVVYSIVLIISLVLVTADANNPYGFTTNATAVVSCFNNIGPGLEMVGPTGNYAGFTIFSKIVLILDMLMGRLEIIPVLMIFYFKAWRRAK
ncbi:MAG: TrkH family potassium uptake protein, partial [Clostridia bacterium]|nr:TrkH family potassium uptake protein [Clostridia bacterium]